MWQGQQPPGRGGYPQGGQPNPYQQPGPYGPPPQPPRGGGNKTKLIAIAAATAVVIAAGVTGFLVLGGDKDAEAKDPKPAEHSTQPTASASADNPRADHDPKPVVPGWKVVTNPAKGVAFDVPPEWDRKQPDWVTYVAEKDDPEDKPLVAMMAPAMLNPTWCSSGSGDKKENTALAAAGSRGEHAGQEPEGAARANAEAWIYGFYTQPDKKKIKSGPAEPYTTKSGLSGTLVSASSSGAPKKNKCDSDGKATAFVFKNPKGNEYTSWTIFGAKGVKDELPDDTLRKILSTVRLMEPPK
ncbi:hypothetical protein [Streptomyces roseoverticillatus]|uniref:hypothetical protein n=1 Tax=Streptomyces roseoverticillatus TaxID=66429 RepID=UPI0004BE710F|nr:hypothetical protein [Streptomyces roseoverticillatus]